MMIQFMENVTDRQAADGVRGRIDWKYALCLELEHSGFNFSVLSEFRTRLVTGGVSIGADAGVFQSTRLGESGGASAD